MGIRGVPPGLAPNLDGFLRELRAAIANLDTKVSTVTNKLSGSGTSGGSGGGSGGGGGGGGGTTPGTENCSVNPPAPTSLSAIPASMSITLVWAQDSSLSCYDVTEIWAKHIWNAWNSTYNYQPSSYVIYNGVVYRSKQINNKNHVPTDTTWWLATSLIQGDRVKISEVSGTSYVHSGLTPNDKWTYWIRNRNKSGLLSPYFPNDDIGVTATTTLDPYAYLELLTGAITATQLYSDLGSRIDKIDVDIPGRVSLVTKTTNLDNGLSTTNGIVAKKVATFRQATQPTSTTAYKLASGDIWINTADQNKAYRFNGSSWDRIDNTQIDATAASVLNKEDAKIGYCSIAAYTDKASCQAAGGVWYPQPLAAAVKQVSVTASNNQSATLQQQMEAVYGPNGLRSQYTLKIDNNGWISGFGLASTTQSDGTVISDFGIRADRFWLAPPTSPGDAHGGPGIQLRDISGNGSGQVIRTASTVLSPGARPTYFAYLETTTSNGVAALNPFATGQKNRQWISLSNIRNSLSGSKSSFWNQAFVAYGVGYYTWTDYTYGYGGRSMSTALPGVSNANNVIILAYSGSGQWYTTAVTDPTQSNSDPAKLIPPNLLPFVVTSTSQTYNGITVPPGVYMNNAYMVSAMIGRATMTGAIGSDNYVPGASGWQIDYLGNAEFNTVVVRGASNLGSGFLVNESAQAQTNYYPGGYNILASNWVYGFVSPPGRLVSLTFDIDMQTGNTQTSVYISSNLGSFDAFSQFQSGMQIGCRHLFSSRTIMVNVPSSGQLVFTVTANAASATGDHYGNAIFRFTEKLA